jgi:membrane fusion protein (multidrug efflux system)
MTEPKSSAPTKSKPVRTSRKQELPLSKKWLFIGLALLAVFGLGLVAWQFWLDFSAHESTEDAYVVAHVHNISTRVAGTVVGVAVDENQPVKAGQLLVTVDARDYAVKVEQARAALRLAQQQAQTATVSIPEAAANAQAKAVQATGSIGSAESAISQAEAGVAEAPSRHRDCPCRSSASRG